MELKDIIEQPPSWLENRSHTDEICLNTVISVQRNLANYPFPHSATVQEKQALFSHITEQIISKGILGETPLPINLMEISDIAKTLLFERDFISLNTIHGAGDRGIILSDSGTRIAINTDSHITISRTAQRDTVESQWHTIDTVDTLLGKELTYAYQSDRGYLLNRPDHCGTGLSVSYTLHLPGLVYTDTIEQVLSGAAQLGLAAEGKFRNSNETWGALFTITGAHYAGSSEQEIIHGTARAISEIIDREKEARATLFAEAPLEMEDKIWRSYAVLKYCRLLSIAQLFNLTSTLRLGVSNGIAPDSLTISKLNDIITGALQGSIALALDKRAPNEPNLDMIRADRIRSLIIN